MQIKNIIYSGLFATIGSLFGKFLGHKFEENPYSWILQIICLIMMVLFNTLNMRFFLNSLQETNETLTAVVMSSASNYLFSFAFGMLIFNETISMLSILGIFLILIGLYFLCDNNKLKTKIN